MNGNFAFHNPTRLHFGENAMEFLKDEGLAALEAWMREIGIAMNIRSQRYSARACNGNVPREVREGRKDERRLSELGGLGVRQTCPVPSRLLTMKNTSES